jgi:hypothetical protein
MVAFSQLALLCLATAAVAHPGHEEHVVDRQVKRSFLAHSRRSLDSCAEILERRGTLKRAETRRQTFVEELTKKTAGTATYALLLYDTLS